MSIADMSWQLEFQAVIPYYGRSIVIHFALCIFNLLLWPGKNPLPN